MVDMYIRGQQQDLLSSMGQIAISIGTSREEKLIAMLNSILRDGSRNKETKEECTSLKTVERDPKQLDHRQ